MPRTDYVQISRDQLEDWLNGLRWQWSRKEGRAGIYFLHFSDVVGVKLSSTIGSRDDAMGRGQASMNLELVSLVTGHVLNRKARDRKYFQRTKGWMTTWAKGLEHWEGVFKKSQGFYDAIAVIKDREQYKADLLTKIENTQGWEDHDVLRDFHSRVEGGSVLTAKQLAFLERLTSGGGQPQQAPESGAEDGPVPDKPDPEVERKLAKLRDLYRAAKGAGDDWTMNFAVSVAKQLKTRGSLSPRQDEIIYDKLERYRLLERMAARKLAARWACRQAS